MRDLSGAARAVVALALFTVIAACGTNNTATPATSSTSKPASTAAPATVTTAPVAVSQQPVTIRATGSFTAAETSQVSPLVAGQVISTPVNVGDTVNAGDVIGRLDDRDARARLAQARATLQQAEATAANAKAQAERSASLVNTGDISVGDFQTLTTQVATANAQVAQAEAQITLAQQQVDETVVRAPFRGQVSARPAAAGQFVTTASSIATIVRLQPIKVELQVPEADAGRINIGMPVSAEVASYPAREFTGKVTAKNPALNPESRALTVVAEFRNDDLALNPGMFATAALRLAETQEEIAVPKAAVFTPAGSPSPQVFVAEDGKARLRVIQTGPLQANAVTVTSGLKPGDVVVTSNPEKLFDGQPLNAR